MMKMALTKPRFSRHLQLEPLPQRQTNRSRTKYSRQDELPQVHVINSKRETLPSMSPHDHVDYHQLARKILEDHQLIYKPSRPKDGNSSTKSLACGPMSRLIQSLDSGDLPSPSSDIKPILGRGKGQVSCSSRFLPAIRQSKKVSFAIPSSQAEGRLRHRNELHNNNNSKEINREFVLPTMPMRKYRITNYDKSTKVIHKITQLPDPGVGQQTRQFPDELHGDHKFNSLMAVTSDTPRDLKKLDQKIQARQARGYVTSHSRNFLRKPSKASRSSGKTETITPLNSLERARQVLLLKMQSANVPTNIQRRRVLFLPSLAAPCSEEFAIAMRRTHGKRFVSSPAVIDHVIRGTVPLQSTTALLDAILRPPSTPTARMR